MPRPRPARAAVPAAGAGEFVIPVLDARGMRAADAATIRGGTPVRRAHGERGRGALRRARARPSGLASDLGRLRSRQQRRRRSGRGPPALRRWASSSRSSRWAIRPHIVETRARTSSACARPESALDTPRRAGRIRRARPRPRGFATASWMPSSEPGCPALSRARRRRPSERSSVRARGRLRGRPLRRLVGRGSPARRRRARGDHRRVRRAEAVSRAASGERTLRAARRSPTSESRGGPWSAAARKVWLTETSDVRALLPAAPDGVAQGRLRPASRSSPDRKARSAPRSWQRAARCAPGPGS